MNPALQSKLDQLNLDLRNLFDHLKLYNDDQLNRPGPNGKWSIMQNMQHLMLSELYSVQYVQKKLSFDPELKKAGIASAFRLFLLRLSFVSPFKFKAPEMIDTEKLSDFESYWPTIKKWKEQRGEMETFLNSLDEGLLDREIYKHPAVGRLSTAQMLGFFAAHFRRHERAIRKLTSNLVPQKDGIKAEVSR